MHFRSTGIGKTNVHVAIQQRAHQAFCAVHKIPLKTIIYQHLSTHSTMPVIAVILLRHARRSVTAAPRADHCTPRMKMTRAPRSGRLDAAVRSSLNRAS
jgi:hypothetical protein